MSATPDRPPTFWLVLVRALLPASRRDEVEGDLIEGWRDRAGRARWSRAWAFWRDAVSVVTRRNWPGSPSAERRRPFDVFVAGVLHDVHTAGRILQRRPVFALLAVTVLAAGIGASTAAFAIADRILVRPLPFHEPHRIVALSSVNGSEVLSGRLARYAPIPEVSALGAYYTGSMNVGASGGADRARVAAVSPGFFDVFGVHPVAGRTLASGDDPESHLAVIAFGAWHRLFGGSLALVGQSIRLNGRSYTVLGIMPRRFQLPDATDIWISGLADMQASGTSRILPSPTVVARLAPGVSPLQAAEAFTRADEGRYTRPSQPATATPLRDHLTTYGWSPVVMMTATVMLLLAATSASAAGLVLSRLRERESELIVRSALGAGRVRLLRQLIAECLLLTVAATAIGLLLATASLSFVAAAIEQIPGVPAVDADLGRLDRRVAVLGAAICTLTGLLFAVGPSLAASRANATLVLRSGRGSSPRLGMFSRGLVVAQMAVALVLLTVTGAAVTTFVRLTSIDLGFSNQHAAIFDLTLPEGRYPSNTDALAFLERFTTQIHAVPGVRNTGATNVGPIWRGTPVVGIRVRPEDSVADEAPALTPTQLFATPGYFGAMGIEVVAGRAFTAEDGQAGGAASVILSETVARSLDERLAAVVGRRVRLERGRDTAVVVGVVRDVRLGGVNGLRDGQLYEPLTERRGWFDGRVTIAIDSTSGPTAVMGAAVAVLASIDPDLTPYNVVPVRDLRARYLPTERLTLAVTSVFSTIALVLCAVGLYGVLSQTVARRTREVGIRIALGADVARVRRSVFVTGLRLAVAGVVVGSAGAYLAFKTAAAFLPRLDAPSFAMFAVNALVLFAVAMLAAWVPARHAAAVDPVRALRAE